jgi:cytochrome c oxidase subunit 1
VAARTEPYRADWRRGRVASWITTVDHKRIGLLYIGTSLVFFAAGGILALLMRAQLAHANEHFVTRNTYNELFTIHGTTMIFLFIVPFWAGLANYLVPLMIGARDMAFPRLNALSYWLFLFGGLTMFLSFFASGGASKSGWYGYPPLSEKFFSPGTGQDLWILSLHLVAISSLVGAINFICTIHNMRVSGMSWMRIPLFVWTIEIYSVLIVIVMPVIGVGLTMLLLDRQVGTHFFLPNEGGSALLYQHLFWFFGHPEVYIIILPAMGVISEVIPVFSRKPIFGYKAIAFSTVAIGFYSMLVWAHHMFSVGLPNFLNVFFMLSSMVIAVPTGVKIFNWIATTWRGNLIFDTAMLWALGFIAVFTSAGLSGHLPRGLPGGLAGDGHLLRRRAHALRHVRGASSRLRALYYWWPKLFGRMLDERLGKIHFWLVFVGFNLTFFPSTARADGDAAPELHLHRARADPGVNTCSRRCGSGVMTIGILCLRLERDQASRVGLRAATIRGWPTRSSGTPPRRRRLELRARPVRHQLRPLRDLRRRLQSA